MILDMLKLYSTYYALYLYQVVKVKQIGSAVTEYGYNQVVKTMETPYGQFVSGHMNNALALSEQYVDKYLPESESESEEGIITVIVLSCFLKKLTFSMHIFLA